MKRTLKACATLLLAAAASAGAQDYPSRPIQIVVPVPPGGAMDLAARVVATDLSRRLGKPVVAENRPGAGALLGAELVAKAQPDGHTLLVHNNSVATYSVLSKSARFDVEKDLAALTIAMSTPQYLLASGGGPAKSLQAVIAYARANPGKLNIAVQSNALQHLDTLRFLQRTNVQMTMVPYNGSTPVIQALLSNDVQFYMGSLAGMLPHIPSGRILPLAVTSSARTTHLPEVPTMKSLGVEFESVSWFAFFVTGGTPKPVIARLASEIAGIVMLPENVERLRAAGYDARTSTPEELSGLVSKQLVEARAVAAAAGVTPQ